MVLPSGCRCVFVGGGTRVVDVDEFRSLRGAERDRVWGEVERAIRCLRGVQLAMLAEVDDSGSYADDAHRTTRAWVQATLNCSKATAVRKVQTARMLTAMPVTAAANRAGRLGPDQLRLLADLHANRRCRGQLPDSDALLSGYAATLTYHDFVQVCQRWQAHADPDGWHRDHDTSVDNRQVRVSRIGHGHILQAHGDALTGEVIAKILDDYTHAEFQADVADHRVPARAPGASVVTTRWCASSPTPTTTRAPAAV